ncbi:hypothetical protein MXB_2700 [Myxobolus squamalis]|nr:hypothetical protein MXB_2700 [Myxobolus squamalis]
MMNAYPLLSDVFYNAKLRKKGFHFFFIKALWDMTKIYYSLSSEILGTYTGILGRHYNTHALTVMDLGFVLDLP